MKIDIQLIPNLPEPKMIFDKTAVVIDVLRATSVIVHAFLHGIKEVIPVKTVEEALNKFEEFSKEEALLGGERDSQRINGFHLGNSPREYTPERIKDKRLIFTTTNGTRAFSSVSPAKRVIIGSFLNINAVVEKCLEEGLDVFIFPAGDEGNFSLEDNVCGGMLIDLLIRKRRDEIRLTDSALAALFIYQRFEDNLIGALHLSRHGKELINIGAVEDILYCSQIDITNIVPFYSNGRIKL